MPRLPCVSFVGGSSFTWHRSGTPGDRSLLRPPSRPSSQGCRDRGCQAHSAGRTRTGNACWRRCRHTVRWAVPGAGPGRGPLHGDLTRGLVPRAPSRWGPRPPGPPRGCRSRRSPRSLSGPGTRCLISKSRPRCSRKRPLRAQEQRRGGRAACGRSSTPPGPAVWTWAKGATTPCLGFPVWRRHTATAPPRGRCGVPWPVKVRGPGVPWPSAVRGLSVNTGSDAAEPRPSASASQNPSVRPHCQMPTNNSETRPHEGLK